MPIMTEQGLRAAVYGRQSRGKEKSISEQVDLCSRDALDQGWAIIATYRDRTSASRYRRRDREEWAQVVDAVRAREFDVLVMWSSSRGDRDLTSWSALLDAARRHAVLLRITDDGRTYDVSKSGDWQALAQQGIGNAVDSDKISTSVRRGQAGSAAAGMPSHGPTAYGYRRVYDPTTGAGKGQEPYAPEAEIVREIFARVARSEPVRAIATDLAARFPGERWYRQRIIATARNPVYIGRRVYNGREFEGNWPALVDLVTFYAAVRVLSDPARLTTRPGRQVHLLSYLALCDMCGEQLQAAQGYYRCKGGGHVAIVQPATDQLVTLACLARLADPAVYDQLRQAGDDADQRAVKAWSDVEELTASLASWRLSAARGQTSPESLAVVETDLTARLRAARRRAELAAIPPAVRDVLEPGEDLATRWAAMTVQARREVIRRLVDEIRVAPAAAQGIGYDPTRLDHSRWRGDTLTWGERSMM